MNPARIGASPASILSVVNTLERDGFVLRKRANDTAEDLLSRPAPLVLTIDSPRTSVDAKRR